VIPLKVVPFCSAGDSDGLLLDDATPFDQILGQCRELENKVNAAMRP